MKGLLHGADPAAEQGAPVPALLPAGAAEPEEVRAGEQKGKAQKKKKRAKTTFTSQKGPKVRQTWGERKEGMEREGESQHHRGEGRREGREAKLKSHVYARATGRADRGAGERGGAQLSRAVTQRHQGPGSTAGDRSSGAGAEPALPGSVPHGREPALVTRGTPRRQTSPTTQRKQGAIWQSREKGQ